MNKNANFEGVTCKHLDVASATANLTTASPEIATEACYFERKKRRMEIIAILDGTISMEICDATLLRECVTEMIARGKGRKDKTIETLKKKQRIPQNTPTTETEIGKWYSDIADAELQCTRLLMGSKVKPNKANNVAAKSLENAPVSGFCGPCRA